MQSVFLKTELVVIQGEFHDQLIMKGIVGDIEGQTDVITEWVAERL